MELELRCIEFFWNDDATKTIQSADVAIGDGSVPFDENYDEYDARIFFYFTDEAEFSLAREGKLEGMEFTITGVEV